MAKELEIKILDIDVEEVKNKIEHLGLEFEFDRIQRLVTYDFHSINSTYNQLLNELNNDLSEVTLNILTKRFKALLVEFLDIAMESDIHLLKQFGFWLPIVKLLKGENLDLSVQKVLMDKRLLEIIDKYSTNPNRWIRVRTDGKLTTITTKYINRPISSEINIYNIEEVEEKEIKISDFEEGIKILEDLGYYYRNYQEKRRIMYKGKDIEIDIDFWPKIPPYIEIEGKNKDIIYDMINALGFDKSEAIVLNTDDVYKKYGLNIYSFPELKLEEEKYPRG